MANPVLVLDFGAQYAQLIARRVREARIYSEVVPSTMSVKEMLAKNPLAIVLSGGPSSVYAEGAPQVDAALFDANLPVFGICYGFQAMAATLGGTVAQTGLSEFGATELKTVSGSCLFDGLPEIQNVWMSHGDKVTTLPPQFKVIASNASTPIAGMMHETKNFYGVQFHPEVTHTRQGLRMLEHFVVDICGCDKLWTPASIIEDAVIRLKQQIGDDQVILGLSGGVDSSVVAMLLHRAIGKNLTCVFVDNGLLRLNEGKQVMDMFGDHFGLNIIKVDAEERFLSALAGENEPEAKRKIIGRVFVEVFDEQAQKLANAKWLAQGTIYPDVIESAGSATGKAHVIKSHHNVGGLPEHMKLGLVEPLRELFKDEVRKVGLELGLPYDMLYRHPFPGPGLGVRVLGEIKKEYCDILRRADAIFIEELHKAELYHKVSQAFAVFLPVKSVGVMGDARKYDWVVSLRAVETIDFMTAHWAHLPYDLLGKVSNRIINEINGISRVVYDISGKPPATIEWE